VNIGMWFERFVIIVTSLHRDYITSSWQMFYPTWVDVGVFVGTFGIFFTLFFLFARFLPVIAVAEVKSIMKGSSDTYVKQMTEAELIAEQQHAFSEEIVYTSQPVIEEEKEKEVSPSVVAQ
jgi:molybdopterin-containing oxidoreductase family membrane subunit